MTSVEQTNAMYNNVGAMHAMANKSRPRVTTTLWEDENTLCFQVEARGISVARREDNDMINGTKLLNVAGMTRGRRDGMLKAEKDRHVVKIGAMHLKGVWIPFDRAASFAQKEGIADALYPLFVEDIRSFLYRQQNPGAEVPMGMPAGDNKQGYMPQHPQLQMQHGQSGPVQGQLHHQLPPQRDMAPQMIPGIQGDQSAAQQQGKQQAAVGRGRAEDLQQTAQQTPQQTPQQSAYSRQQYPYVQQYGVQGYAPMGSTNYPPYASSYNSYPQVVYGNQEYAATQQPMYYQNYQSYDQNQVAQAYSQQQQQQQQQGAQHQQQQHYYQQQQQQQQPKAHASPKEDGQEPK